MSIIDFDNYYNILTLLLNKSFKYTINNIRIDPMFAHHLIRMALNDKSIVGRAKNTHLIIYKRR